MFEHKDSVMWELVDGDPDKVDGRTAFSAAKADDPAGAKVVKNYISYLGEGIANLVNLLRPQAVIIGGGICNEGEYLLQPLRRWVGERIYVEIPSIDDPEEAVQQLGSTAQLEFRDADGNVVMTGDEIKDARSNFGPIDATNISQHYVVLTLKPEAVEKFAAMTKAAANRAAEGKN